MMRMIYMHGIGIEYNLVLIWFIIPCSKMINHYTLIKISVRFFFMFNYLIILYFVNISNFPNLSKKVLQAYDLIQVVLLILHNNSHVSWISIYVLAYAKLLAFMIQLLNFEQKS